MSMAFDEEDDRRQKDFLGVPGPAAHDDKSFGSKASMENMSVAQMEVFSAQMNKEQYYAAGKCHSYWCFTMLILISISNTM